MLSLYPREVEYLSRVEAQIRLGHRNRIQRSAIVRAILNGVESSGLDLTQCADEDSIRRLVAASIKIRKPRRRSA